MGLYKRGDIWYIRYKYQGRLYRKAIGPNKRVAEAKLAKIKAQIAENRHLEIRRDHKINFEEFVKLYIEYLQTNIISWQKEMRRLRKLREYFGKTLITEITAQAIEYYRKERLKKVKPSTTNRELARLKNMFKKAVEWGYLSRNPVNTVKFLPERNLRIRYLTKQEYNRLIAYLTPDLRPLVIVAANTGMRRSELLSLTWADIDFVNNIIKVPPSKNNEHRIIPMNTDVRKTLLNVVKNLNDPHVFLWSDGSSIKNFNSSFAKALKRAGIKDFRFHDLRHTFASWLVISGRDLKVVQELLGHKTLNMVLRYAHLSKAALQEAVEGISGEMDASEVAQKVTQHPILGRVTNCHG
jgi:integrase